LSCGVSLSQKWRRVHCGTDTSVSAVIRVLGEWSAGLVRQIRHALCPAFYQLSTSGVGPLAYFVRSAGVLNGFAHVALGGVGEVGRGTVLFGMNCADCNCCVGSPIAFFESRSGRGVCCRKNGRWLGPREERPCPCCCLCHTRKRLAGRRVGRSASRHFLPLARCDRLGPTRRASRLFRVWRGWGCAKSRSFASLRMTNVFFCAVSRRGGRKPMPRPVPPRCAVRSEATKPRVGWGGTWRLRRGIFVRGFREHDGGSWPRFCCCGQLTPTRGPWRTKNNEQTGAKRPSLYFCGATMGEALRSAAAARRVAGWGGGPRIRSKSF